MSTTDDARLEAIDARGRAAARTLLDDVAARAASTDTATPPAAPATAATGSAAPPEPLVIHLGRPTARGGRRPARRRWLPAAVVAVLAAVAGAVTVATRDDGGPDVSSGSPLDHLLPGWLPAGLEPVRAIDIPDTAAAGFSADVAVYGDAGADDPWSEPLAVVHVVADEELLGDAPSGGEEVTVAGHDARLSEQSEGLGDGSSPAWEVAWPVDDGQLIVTGTLSREDVLVAAEAATTEPAIEASGLPDGYAELARGPYTDSLLFTSLFEGVVPDTAGDGSGLAVTYADPSDTDMVRTAVVVAQRPGPASAVDLLRLWITNADETTVHGRHAVIGRGDELPGSAGEDGVVAVQWAEPDGKLVTVVGFGVAEDAVLQVAEGMRPADAGEVAALREGHAAAPPRQFDGTPEGQVVVASGDSRTGQWRILADAGRRDNIGALTIERVWGAIGSTSSTTGDRVEPPLDLGADFSDGTVVVWGVLWVDAASVTVEAPGVEPVTLAIHEVDGWSHPVVADSFPDDHFPPSGGDVVVVARNADGREVARNTSVLGDGG
jgi:hypothetical protein